MIVDKLEVLLECKDLEALSSVIDILQKQIHDLQDENKRLKDKLKNENIAVHYKREDKVVEGLSGSISACAPNAKIIRR